MKTIAHLSSLAILAILGLFLAGCAGVPAVYAAGTKYADNSRLIPSSPFQVKVVNNTGEAIRITDGNQFVLANMPVASVVTLNFNNHHLNFKDRFFLFAGSETNTAGRVASRQINFYVRSYYTQENDRQEELWEIRASDIAPPRK